MFQSHGRILKTVHKQRLAMTQHSSQNVHDSTKRGKKTVLISFYNFVIFAGKSAKIFLPKPRHKYA
jgi:hypothetical protein